MTPLLFEEGVTIETLFPRLCFDSTLGLLCQ